MLRAVRAVQAIVRRHDRPGPRIAHDALERSEVDFAERALVDSGIRDEPGVLLVVRREMLHARGDAARLDAADHRRPHDAGKQRILAEVLEIPSAQRAALDVDARTEHNADTLLAGLLADCRAHALDEVGVERAGKRAGGRIAHGWNALTDTEMVRLPLLFAQAVRTV